jgi:hypothetical protein
MLTSTLSLCIFLQTWHHIYTKLTCADLNEYAKEGFIPWVERVGEGSRELLFGLVVWLVLLMSRPYQTFILRV